MFGPIKEFIRLLRIKVIQLFLGPKKKISIGGSVFVIAPHPDDEVMGCAGLIQRLLKRGKEVHVVIFTGGGASNGDCDISSDTIIERRRELAVKINHNLGLPKNNLHLLNYMDGHISYDDSETARLQDLIYHIQPDAIFIPHQKGEGWPDHIESGNIIKRIVADQYSIQLYEYCVWFWYYNAWKIKWHNAFVLKLTKEEHQNKERAILDYTTPLAPCGKPWSGVLPKLLICACCWTKELYFKVER